MSAKPKPMSPTQDRALCIIAASEAPMTRADLSRAGIAPNTVAALEKRGAVVFDVKAAGYVAASRAAFEELAAHQAARREDKSDVELYAEHEAQRAARVELMHVDAATEAAYLRALAERVRTDGTRPLTPLERRKVHKALSDAARALEDKAARYASIADRMRSAQERV